MAVDRVGNWKRFSQHMEEYIRDHSVEKYGIENSSGFDLMSCNHFRGKWSGSLDILHEIAFDEKLWPKMFLLADSCGKIN